jgi:hypothetical protein
MKEHKWDEDGDDSDKDYPTYSHSHRSLGRTVIAFIQTIVLRSVKLSLESRSNYKCIIEI